MDRKEETSISIFEAQELFRQFKRERKYRKEGIDEFKTFIIYIFNNLPEHLRVITSLDLIAMRVNEREILEPYYTSFGNTLLANVIGQELADEGIGVFRFIKGTKKPKPEQGIKEIGELMNTRVIAAEEALNIVRESNGSRWT